MEQATAEDLVKVDRLNSLMDPGYRWECWRAKHDHIDILGAPIKENEYHWFRRCGPAYDHAMRLSLTSMRSHLSALLDGNGALQLELKERAWKRQQNLFDEVRHFLPRTNQD